MCMIHTKYELYNDFYNGMSYDYDMMNPFEFHEIKIMLYFYSIRKL